MSDGDLPDVLRRRLDLVSRLALATSQLQKCRQSRMAADMDAQRCDLARDEAASDAAARDLQREWDEALRRSEEAESGVARCEALIDELERSLAEADREIAGHAPGRIS